MLLMFHSLYAFLFPHSSYIVPYYISMLPMMMTLMKMMEMMIEATEETLNCVYLNELARIDV